MILTTIDEFMPTLKYNICTQVFSHLIPHSTSTRKNDSLTCTDSHGFCLFTVYEISFYSSECELVVPRRVIKRLHSSVAAVTCRWKGVQGSVGWRLGVVWLSCWVALKECCCCWTVLLYGTTVWRAKIPSFN